MSDTIVNLQLGIDEALVLFEALADFHNQPSLAVPSPAERLALIRLHGVLEQSLVEPFRPDYKKHSHDWRHSSALFRVVW